MSNSTTRNPERKFFGKQLETILEISHANTSQNVDASTASNFNSRKITINNIQPRSDQPRKYFEPDELDKLAASIKSQGILQPILVRPQKDYFEIIAGERRWRAAQMAGLTEMPCVILNVDDKSVRAYALIENMQRADLNPIEEAEGVKELMEEFSMTHEQIGQYLGLPRTTITNMLRLLTLSEIPKEHLKNKKINVGHAKVLMALDPAQQIQLTEKIIQKNLSVRDTENELKNLKKKERGESAHDLIDLDVLTKIKTCAEMLSRSLSIKVEHSILGNKGGRLVVPLKSIDEIEILMSALKRLAL